MHAGRAIKKWRTEQGISASRLGRMLPDPIETQSVYLWEKLPHFRGTAANGLYLVDNGAFPREVLTRDADSQQDSGSAA